MVDVNKKFFGATLHLETIAKVRKLAESLGISMVSLVETILENELRKRVQLDAKDYEWIAEQVRQNEAKRKEEK